MLLALNWFSVLVFQTPSPPRLTVLCSPYFLTDSLGKNVLGVPRGIVLSGADRQRTASHDSGRALVG